MKSALASVSFVGLLLVAGSSASLAYYQPDETDKFAGKRVMNGIEFKTYKNFPRQWKLVTTRYRKDSREIRFTYANKLALNTLLKHGAEYPDGAVFAKISTLAEADPSFSSSETPSGSTRVQYMVRDKKRFAETAGWGYALFTDKGLTFPEDPVAKTKACAACHQLVADRGHVFSEPAPFIFSDWKSPLAKSRLLAFEVVEKAVLPKGARALLPAAVNSVSLLKSGLIQEIFQGTLDELIPALVREVKEKNRPAAIVAPEGERFSLVWVEEASDKCPGEATFWRATTTLAVTGSNAAPSAKVSYFCESPHAPGK